MVIESFGNEKSTRLLLCGLEDSCTFNTLNYGQALPASRPSLAPTINGLPLAVLISSAWSIPQKQLSEVCDSANGNETDNTIHV